MDIDKGYFYKNIPYQETKDIFIPLTIPNPTNQPLSIFLAHQYEGYLKEKSYIPPLP